MGFSLSVGHKYCTPNLLSHLSTVWSSETMVRVCWDLGSPRRTPEEPTLHRPMSDRDVGLQPQSLWVELSSGLLPTGTLNSVLCSKHVEVFS